MSAPAAVRKEKAAKAIPYSPAKRPKPTYGKYGEPTNNYFQMPTCFPEACARKVFQGRAEERMVELVMMEEWGGFGGKFRKGAPISLTEFAVRLGQDEKTMSNCSTRLLKVGILELQKNPRGNANCYHVNLAKMEAAGPYVYEPPKLAVVPKQEPAPRPAQYVIPPGTIARIPVPWPIPGTDQWGEHILDVSNDFDIPVAVWPDRADKASLLHLSKHIEQVLGMANKRRIATALECGSENKAKTQQVIESTPVTAFSTPVAKLLSAYFGEPSNSSIVARVRAAGPDLTPDQYSEYASAKLPAILAKAKANRKNVGTGMLIHLAKEANELYAQANAERREWEASHPGACPTCKGNGIVMDHERRREKYCDACEGTGKLLAARSGASHA